MTEPEPDDADMTVALDVIDIRLKCLEIAAQEDNLAPQATHELAAYHFNFAMTGLIVPYPAPPEKPKKLKAVP